MAFEQEIVALLPRLRRLARALSRDVATADDLVQIAVERALTRRDQWRPGTRLDAWVMRIMKNAWIDETRSRARWGKVVEPEDAGLSVADQADHTDAMAISQAMARLPDEQRLAVALVLVDGLSYAEAADVLEIPPGTLNSRLVRGRMALMEALA
ncbi:MAG TPA: sigma-70 family RNA polymerase sigma factor [Caulobacteraceae bacterium]|nr:sigma-70 family RNA polymerase sigma factor [Caulobacteraceae bacterium]